MPGLHSSLLAAAMATLVVAPAAPETPPTPPQGPQPMAQPSAETTPATAVAPDREEEIPDDPDFLGTAMAARQGGLTSTRVAQQTAVESPELDLKQADIEIAAAKVDQVTATFAPDMTLSATYTRISDINLTFGSGALVGALNTGPLSVGGCPDGSTGCVVDSAGVPVGADSFNIPQVLDNFSLAASLSVPLSDYVLRSYQGLKAAKAAADATRLAKVAEERKVRTDAKIFYYNWLRAVAQIAVAEDNLRSAEARLQEAQTGYRVGVMTKSDLLRIEAATARVRTGLITAQAFEVLARRNLAVIMNEPSRTYQVGEDVLGPPRLDTGGKVEDLIAEAEMNRPELDVINRNVRALRLGMKTERAGYYPRLDGFADALYARPNPRFFPPTEEFNGTWQAGLRLSYSITGAIQTRQKLKELHAQDRQLAAQLEALRRGIELEVTRAWVERSNAVASIELAKKSREASEAAYKATVAQFRAGSASVTDLITAQGEQVNSQLQFVNAHIDLRVAEARLIYATGRDVVG